MDLQIIPGDRSGPQEAGFATYYSPSCERTYTPTVKAFRQSNLRVALLTNSLSPHSLPVCERLNSGVGQFQAFLSSAADQYHNFPKPVASFPITVQRSFNRLRMPRRAYGYWQRSELHVPYDTYPQLQAYDPHLILSVQLGLRTALAVLYRWRRPGVKLILWATLSQHTEARRHWLRRRLRCWIVRHIDGAFVNGRQGEEYLRLLGYTGPVETVPYAIEETSFRGDHYRPIPAVYRLIYAGQLVPQKGLREFCETLSLWCTAHPTVQIEFKLVGDGPEARVLRTMAHESNLKIVILSTMAQDRLALEYHRADMMAFPTLGDEWGVVVNEAMIAGLPVLGSLLSQAVVELVRDGETGWVFDPREAQSVLSAMDRAFSTEVVRLEEMSAQARQDISRVSPSIVGARAVAALERIYAAGTRPTCNP